MATRPQKKRRSTFPLTIHPTGQYCKKIHGRLYYFGKDKKEALRLYHEQAADLHAGRGRRPDPGGKTLRDLCNLYLDHENARRLIGDISDRHFADQRGRLREFAKSLRPNRQTSDITTLDLQKYKQKLIKRGLSPNTINNYLKIVKAMFNWAVENEVVEKGPNLRALKKVTIKKVERQTFTAGQVRKLVEQADIQMRAMILLGLNCAFGPTDCAQLKWDHLDLEAGRVCLARGKTGIQRNIKLWSDTIAAIRAVPQRGDLVFYTRHGNPWVRMLKDGKTSDNAVSKAFAKLLKRCDIVTEKGTGFYSLRRTAATIAAQSGDVFSVQKLLGHVDTKMASTYVQDVSEQTDRVTDGVHDWFVE
ncbi:MAG: site-specific integrase [Phycisphaerales bacterium]|nr:MAG: site-specific integrase [Phycisphaerales bacterium]